MKAARGEEVGRDDGSSWSEPTVRAVGGVTGAGEENEAVAQQRTPARLRGALSTATRNVEAVGSPGGPSSREDTNVTQVLEANAAIAA